MKRMFSIILAIAVGFTIFSCAATGYQRYNTQSGAVIGGALGALAGQAIGRNTAGTLIGAGGGMLLGALVGNAMDQEQAYRRSTGYAYPPSSYAPSGGAYYGENPPGQWVEVPGSWVNGRWVPAHRAWVPVNP